MAIKLSVGPVVEFVAGDLLGQKHVVRLVAVERADDVVAIPPDVRPVVVVLVAVGIGVACDIQPVTAPTLAVVRRGEQLVDQPFPGARRVVGEKLRRLSGVGGRPIRSRYARRSSVSCRLGVPLSDPFLGSRLFQESIDRVLEMCGTHRHRALNRQLEGPVVASASGERRVFSGRSGSGRFRRRARRDRPCAPMGAIVYPRLDRRDLLGRQRSAVEWHGRLLESGDKAVQLAVVGPSWNQNRSVLAALERAVARAQIELREVRRGVVARPAAGLENRFDVFFE